MTSKLRQRLEDPARSGVYRTSKSDAISEALRGSKLDLAQVSLRHAKDKDKLLEAIGKQLGLPAWFGGNWDALEDCLSDLSWRGEEGHVLVFEGFELNDEFGILIDILGSCAEFWVARRKSFFAVFIDPERRLTLADLYREA